MSHLVTEPRNFAEVTKLLAGVKKAWLEEILKEIKNLIKNQTFLMNDPEKGDSVTPCMYVYKENTLSYGSLNKLKLRVLVRRDSQNREIIGYTWYPTA